jgi:hypothetical protein
MYVTKKNKIASLDYFRRVIKRQIESLPQNLTALDRLRLARLQHRLAQLEAIQTDVEQTGADRSIVWVCPMSDCEKHNANDDDVSTMFCAHCRRGPFNRDADQVTKIAGINYHRVVAINGTKPSAVPL